MALADDELSVGKNHARNDEWIDITIKRILVRESEVVNECLKLTKVSSELEPSKESGSEPQTPRPPLKNLQEASLSSEVMTFTYQDHSPREISGLGTMKHAKLKNQESSNNNVLGPVTVSNPEPIISSVPIEVKTNDQMVKNQNNVNVKQIRIDNGIEFRNIELESFCDEKGVSQNFSSPYTLEQNGVAKRNNITLIEAARTMTPYEIFRESIPDISYFHVFGCLVFIHNHKDHLGKFNAKADDGNKKDEHGIVTKNKTRLAAQGYSQEERIDETFNPVARMEAIRIFLAFATYMNFIVFKMDDDKGISICQEQYTRNLLKKYEISYSSSVKTPMVPPNILGPDLAGFDLNGYSDYGGCNIVRKSTSCARQIIGGKKFWCTAIAYDPNPPINDSEARPLKEYLIKFLVMNGKKPLILDYKTFVVYTGLDYAKGIYVSHPSPEAVKAESAKIVENLILLDRTLVLKNTFPMAWRILFTFVVQVLDGNYSSTEPTEGSEQSYSVSSRNILDPQDLKRNKQLAGTRLPFTVYDEGTIKTTSLPKGTHGEKDSKLFKPPADMEPLTTLVADPSGTDAKYEADQTQSTRLRYRSLSKNKGKTSFELELDSKTLQLTTFTDVQALLLCDDEMVQEGDKDDVLEAGEEMDEDILPTDEEAQSQPPNQEQPGSSYYLQKLSQALYDRIAADFKDQHEEVVASYADLKASIEGYYDENFDHMDQTDNLVKETMKTIDNINKFGIDERAKLLKALNRFSETLEVDSTLKEEIKKMAESYNTTSGNLSGLKKLINNAKLLELLTKLKGFWSTLITLSTHALIPTAPLLEVYASIGENLEKQPEDEATETQIEQELERLTRAVPMSTVKPITRTNLEVALIESASRPLLTDPILKIHLTEEQIQAYMEKEERIKKKAIEAKLLVMTKSKLIKVVHEEVKKAKIIPKTIESAKGGEKFKKIQDVEHQVHKREHSKEVKTNRSQEEDT
nr:retrovirus-related Pol polyprotein from transposon TNT 1-94 [Tanacetum cinerariifolium]